MTNNSYTTLGPGNIRDKQKAETRLSILIAARKDFKEKGFEKATIRSIARRAGVAVGTIHSHFKSKHTLLVATVINDLVEVQKDAWQTLPEDVPLIERMLHMASKGYEYWCKRPSISRALLSEMYFTPGPAREQLHMLDREALKLHVQYFEIARQRGEIHRDTNIELLSRLVFSLYLTLVLNSLGHLDRKKGAEEELESMVNQTRGFLEIIFKGIGPRNETESI